MKIQVVNQKNKPVSQATISVFKDNEKIATGTTCPEGNCIFSTNFDYPIKICIDAQPNSWTPEEAVHIHFELTEGEPKVLIDFENRNKCKVLSHKDVKIEIGDNLKHEKLRPELEDSKFQNNKFEPKHPENREGGHYGSERKEGDFPTGTQQSDTPSGE